MIEGILSLIFETLFCLTGEIVLFLVTFGRHKVRWDLYTRERPVKFVVFSDLSTLVGFGFWIVVAVAGWWILWG